MLHVRSSLAALAFAVLLPAGLALAETPMPLPTAAGPEEVGLSSVQLARIEAATRQHIEAGLVPGAEMLVARRGKIAWHKTLGFRDRNAEDVLAPNSIFRIYSMTKPIVSIAVMMLVEEGRLQVGDPVSQYLPEMADMKVGIEKDDASGKKVLELIAPERQITVQDLLRHTSGLTYGSRGNSLINDAYNAAKIGDRSLDLKEFVTRVSKLPLKFSPGTRWEYGISVDVLGRLVEVVSGKKLSDFLAERILNPLGMTDSAFSIPADKLSRAAQAWQRPNAPPMTPRFDVAEKPAFESGGGGLTSTMHDYLRFTTMLANGGELDGVRIVGKKTLEFMTANQIGNVPGRPPGLGFGLGFEVRLVEGEAGLPGSVGEYGWAGNAGTLFWIDPKEQLIAIYMVQVSDGDRIMLRNQFRTMVQAAIIN